MVVVLAAWLIGGPLPVARGEGSSQLGTSQRLQSQTTMYTHIRNAGERIRWTGSGKLSVHSPVDDSLLVQLNSGQQHNVDADDAFKVSTGTSSLQPRGQIT